MKTFLASVALMLCCVGCSDMSEINFVYFNLSPNEIVIDSVAGLPPWASPGVLVPVHSDGRPSEASATSYDGAVNVPATLKIVWRERGASHQAELKRDELGIPAKFKKGKISFTYLGGDKWRVKVLDQ
jgi:hypothetical protein